MSSKIERIEVRHMCVPTIFGDMSEEAYPGELLTMADGSRWFHPYNGRRPYRETPPSYLTNDP